MITLSKNAVRSAGMFFAWGVSRYVLERVMLDRRFALVTFQAPAVHTQNMEAK